jgi:hypothetical protein
VPVTNWNIINHLMINTIKCHECIYFLHLLLHLELLYCTANGIFTVCTWFPAHAACPCSKLAMNTPKKKKLFEFKCRLAIACKKKYFLISRHFYNPCDFHVAIFLLFLRETLIPKFILYSVSLNKVSWDIFLMSKQTNRDFN